MKRIKILVTIIVLSLMTGCASAPVRPSALSTGNYDYLKEYLTWFINKEMKRSKTVGLSVALVDDQQVVWSSGFGYADKNGGVPANSDTLYRVGSVSKLFTATAAVQLAEQGRMELDRPLVTYLPDFQIKSRFPGSAPITPRTIMTHHSGIPSDRNQGMWTKNPLPLAELPALISEEFAAFPPDTVYSYSNLSMSLLGVALQKVTGQDFATYMQQTMLQALGMENSSFAPGINKGAFAAKAYHNGSETEEPLLRDVPAGGLNSSVRDMSRFIKMVLAGGTIDGRQIVKKESLQEMLRPQNSHIPLDGDFPVGLGWMLGGLGNINIANVGTVAHHGGATIYHRAQLVVLPEAKLGVVVLANSSEAGKLVSEVATEALKLAVEIKTGQTQPKPDDAVTRGTLSDKELRDYAGEYATIAGHASLVTRSDDLKATFAGETFRLMPRQDKQLQLQYRLLGFIPIDLGELSRFGLKREVVSGHELLYASDGIHRLLVGEKINPEPISPAWRRRLGSYQIANIGDDVAMVGNIVLREEGGLLLVEYQLTEFGGAKISNILRCLSDDTAVFAGLWRGMGETVRVVKENGTEQLLYSGYKLIKQQQ